MLSDVFIMADEKIRQRQYATMFALQTKNPKSSASQFIFQFRDKHQQVRFALPLVCLADHHNMLMLGPLVLVRGPGPCSHSMRHTWHYMAAAA